MDPRVVLPLVAGLVAAGMLFWGFWSLRRKRLIEDVPTSPVKGVFLGLNEVKGVVECERPLVSFLAAKRCVYYRFTVEEHWQRTVTTTDSKGRTQTRTESGWRTVGRGEKRRFFDLRDRTGALRVRPRRAEIDAPTVFSRTCGRGDPLYYAKGPASAISNSTHRRRFCEEAIEVGARVYVMGPARLRRDVVAPEIAYAREAELFLVSTRSESQLRRGYGAGALFKLAAGTLAAWMLPVGPAMGRARDFGDALAVQAPLSAACAGAYLGVVGIYYLVLVFNGLVAVRQRLDMAKSMVEVQLKRRHDLIPRLVACVKGYAKHERELHERVARLRTTGSADERAGEQQAALREVFAVAEAYPGLKADANFGRLNEELIDTEDRIAFARDYLNGAVRALRDRIATLPDALVARLAGFQAGRMFRAEGFERTAPRVEL